MAAKRHATLRKLSDRVRRTNSTPQRENHLNYYGAKQLADSFRIVRKNTMTIAREIPEEKYGFRPNPATRSVSELLTHIALVYSFQHQIHGVEHRTSRAQAIFSAARMTARRIRTWVPHLHRLPASACRT